MQAWHVLNDQNVKILYIFRKDGSLLISANGDVEKAHWEYIKENQTILIEQSTQCLLFHPIFYDDVVLAIQQDGTDRFLAMVNGDKVDKFLELTVESINKHFLYAAHPEIREAETREAREKREREELERKRILEERRHEIEREHADEIQEAVSPYQKHTKAVKTISIVVCAMICVIVIISAILLNSILFAVMLIITTILFSFIITNTVLEEIKDKMLKAKEEIISKYL